MDRRRLSGGRVAAVVGVVFLVYWQLEDVLRLASGYRGLFDEYGFWVPRSLLSLVEILLVLVAVCLLHRLGPWSGLRELGFRGPASRALGLMALAVAPMWIAFGVGMRANPEFALGETLYLALLSPLAEETVFRGFAFGQLWRRAGWRLWPALVVCALVFGYAHAESAGGLSEMAGLFLLTGLGAAVFTWLFARWGGLVAPLTLHVLMNLAWNVWSVGDSALAGWMPFAFQLLTVALAVLFTVWASRRGWLRQPGGDRGDRVRS